MNQPGPWGAPPGSTGGAPPCPRCGRRQPPFAGPTSECLYCGTRLPATHPGQPAHRQYGDWNRQSLGRQAPALRRWVAHPPALPIPGRGRSTGRPAQRRSWRSDPYSGPPSYGSQHPRGGFRPGSWRWPDAQELDQQAAGSKERRRAAQRLRYSAVAVAVTAMSAFAAAGAESWRLALLLRGRTEVLDGGQVRASDLFVGIAGWWTLGLAVLAAGLALPTIVVTHRLSAALLARTASRPVRQLWQYLLVPVVNLYGAGIVVAETDRQLLWSDEDRRRSAGGVSWLVWVVWALWVAGGVLALLALIRMFSSGDQARADGVQLRIAADLIAGLLGVMLTVLLWRWSRLVDVRRTAATGWVVAAPEPTSERRVPCPRGEKNEHADGRVSTVGEHQTVG